mmetsp:Transcript_13977/g.22894  ORF Transcript_13977/g.22894 Transcript_13977/m.22894 type:complete len:248 (-) Transcript_13977:4501-5244(-)
MLKVIVSWSTTVTALGFPISSISVQVPPAQLWPVYTVALATVPAGPKFSPCTVTIPPIVGGGSILVTLGGKKLNLPAPEVPLPALFMVMTTSSPLPIPGPGAHSILLFLSVTTASVQGTLPRRTLVIYCLYIVPFGPKFVPVMVTMPAATPPFVFAGEAVYTAGLGYVTLFSPSAFIFSSPAASTITLTSLPTIRGATQVTVSFGLVSNVSLLPVNGHTTPKPGSSLSPLILTLILSASVPKLDPLM